MPTSWSPGWQLFKQRNSPIKHLDIWLARSTDVIPIGKDKPGPNPIVQASLFKVLKAPVGQWITQTRKCQACFSNRSLDWLHQLANDWTVTLRSVSAWTPWWALLRSIPILCWLLSWSSTLPDSSRRKVGREGDRASSSSRLAPLVKNTTFQLQFQVPLSIKADPLADSVPESLGGLASLRQPKKLP